MIINKKSMLGTAVVMASLAGTTGIVHGAPVTTTTVGGYVKFDSIYNQENDTSGQLREQALLTLNGNESADEEGDLYFSSYESRIKFTSETTGTPIGNLKAVIEGDFYSGATQNIVNLRHAYFTQGNLTIGQTWSTFMDLSALPEKGDFGGAAARIFSRKSLVKYSTNIGDGKLDLAVEAPLYKVADQQDAVTPDFIAKYTLKTGFGHISTGVLIQNVAIDNTSTDIDSSTAGDQFGTLDDAKFAVAARVSGRVNIGQDNLKFAVIAGQGLGGYLNFGDTATGAASLDGTKVELSDSLATRVSFQHHWSTMLRSNLVYGTTTADINGLDSGDYTSTHLNLIFSPYKAVKFGGEIINATKEVVGGTEDKKLNRLQVFAKYAF
jgi:hypothetical protein